MSAAMAWPPNADLAALPSGASSIWNWTGLTQRPAVAHSYPLTGGSAGDVRTFLGGGLTTNSATGVDEAFGSVPDAKDVGCTRGGWEESVAGGFRALAGLRSGWDGYGSQPISTAAIEIANRVLMDALQGREVAMPPAIVPVADGGIQIEWHRKAVEMELSVAELGVVSVWVRDRGTGIEFEAEGADAVELFFRWAPRSAAPNVHATNVPVSKGPDFVELAA